MKLFVIGTAMVCAWLMLMAAVAHAECLDGDCGSCASGPVDWIVRHAELCREAGPVPDSGVPSLAPVAVPLYPGLVIPGLGSAPSMLDSCIDALADSDVRIAKLKKKCGRSCRKL